MRGTLSPLLCDDHLPVLSHLSRSVDRFYCTLPYGSTELGRTRYKHEKNGTVIATSVI